MECCIFCQAKLGITPVLEFDAEAFFTEKASRTKIKILAVSTDIF